MYLRFKDRHQAGILLARDLEPFAHRRDVIVLALPRGGVPVAFEVARILDLPMDVFMVRKLGAPGHEEFAIGSIASGGVRFIDNSMIQALGVSESVLAEIIKREEQELERRESLYRGNRPPLDLRGKTVIVVDDGLATGSTMRAAVTAIRKLGPKDIVVAVPVCAPLSDEELQNDVRVWCVCAYAPEPFYAVGLWYENFEQTSDEEVQRLIAMADAGRVSARHAV